MDVWLLFGLLLPFVSFILTLIEEIVKNDDEIGLKTIGSQVTNFDF